MNRTVLLALILTAFAISGCDLFAGRGPDVAPPPDATHPMPRPTASSAPPAAATTAEAFDTTTDAERAAATETPVAAKEVKLGHTVATLGNPADPGFWLETPLASKVGPGRVVATANGKSVQVELRPIEGAAGAGSRISLPALRLLGIGLTGLHEVDVFGL